MKKSEKEIYRDMVDMVSTEKSNYWNMDKQSVIVGDATYGVSAKVLCRIDAVLEGVELAGEMRTEQITEVYAKFEKYDSCTTSYELIKKAFELANAIEKDKSKFYSYIKVSEDLYIKFENFKMLFKLLRKLKPSEIIVDFCKNVNADTDKVVDARVVVFNAGKSSIMVLTDYEATSEYYKKEVIDLEVLCQHP